jgi:hypothetical protein
MEDNNRLNNEFHGVDGPMQVSDPGHIDQMSRWFVQAVQAWANPSTPISTGLAARRRLLPVHEPPRPPLFRRLCLPRAARADPRLTVRLSPAPSAS